MILLALLLQAAPTPPATIRVAPDTALVERDPATGVGYANFDFVIGSRARSAARAGLHRDDRAQLRPAELVLRRFCDTSGLSPCIRTVPGPDPRIRAPLTIVYNPFDELPAGLAAARAPVRARVRRLPAAPWSILSWSRRYRSGTTSTRTDLVLAAPRAGAGVRRPRLLRPPSPVEPRAPGRGQALPP